jgi:hypothetical protein
MELALGKRDASRQGVDLHAREKLDRRRHRPSADELAVRSDAVVVGDREGPDAGAGGGPDELDRLEDAV